MTTSNASRNETFIKHVSTVSGSSNKTEKEIKKTGDDWLIVTYI